MTPRTNPILFFLPLLISTGVSVDARTVYLTLPDIVREADVIVVATATTEPKRGELLYFNNINRRIYGDQIEWVSPPTSREGEVTNALKELIRVRDQLASTTNLYAANLVSMEILRHQYQWHSQFRVSDVLKGQAGTNITVRWAQPYADDRPALSEGTEYILFLHYGLDGNLGLIHVQRALPVAKEYEWYDRWETLSIDLPFRPLAVRKNSRDEARKFTHERFLQRIRDLEKEQRDADTRRN